MINLPTSSPPPGSPSLPLSVMLRASTTSIALLALVPVVVWRLLKPKQLPLPPGPPRRFLTGNLHQVPKVKQWLVYADWAKTYGPIMSLKILNRTTIIITSAKVATDLLEARANIYSSRPFSWMLSRLAGNENAIFSLLSTDSRFPKYRRMLVAGLNKRAATGKYRPVLEGAVRRFLKGIAANADDYLTLLNSFSGGISLKIAYGYDVQEPIENDYFVKLIENAEGTAPSLVQNIFFVEFFPWLRFVPAWFPTAYFQRFAAAKKKILDAMVYEPNAWAKKNLETNPTEASYYSEHYFAEDGTPANLSKEDAANLMWTAGAIYTGGAHTTSSGLTTLLLLLSCNPAVQARIQAELDSVVGSERLVNSDDRASLPYLAAVIKEALRWAPPAPNGLRHATTQDDIYEGYFIPKHAIVMCDIWAITHDPEMYPDPFTFNPDRFLGESGKQQRDPYDFVFGFGRRVCPGRPLAEESIFLTISNLLAIFTLTPAVDEDGREIDPMVGLDWRTGFVTQAQGFKFCVTPRSADRLAILEA
ncbi:Cytochrome P450 [Mycena chlorophos]|uniref:Cytochrome P450 n=1 Tax=Mycena chlorophos TaxID=658473 RepID=A0A8H6VXR2_MYCCL|nr:Cytochrome P450 [Mycena chlorophos]